MIKHSQLREHIIRPTLKEFGMYSMEAEELLIATCAHESLGGSYLKQVSGPALGIYQMEPITHDDIWSSYLYYQPVIKLKIYEKLQITSAPSSERLVYDLKYATIMARIHYYRISEGLPHYEIIESIFTYYKKYYNTINGSANLLDFIEHYRRYLNA